MTARLKKYVFLKMMFIRRGGKVYNWGKEGRKDMFKDALKKYLDDYIELYRERFGTYPQIDAEITEEPSACFFGEKFEDGYIQWKYVGQPNPIAIDRLEKERHVHICDEVKQLYNSYLFLELQGFLDGREEQILAFDPVTEETDGLFFPSDDLPATEEYPNLIIIGRYGQMDASLCVDVVTGEVYSWDLNDDTYEFEYEGRYREPELLADSLTELLSRLSIE